MESIAYLISEKFALVAVDANFVADMKQFKFVLTDAQKAYKLNDHHLISVVGNEYKITDVNKYLLKLNELGYNQSYEQIVEDLKDAFGSSKGSLIDNLTELLQILKDFTDEAGNIKLDEVYAHLEIRPELVALMKDTIPAFTNNAVLAITQIFVFSWDLHIQRLKFMRMISVGQDLTESEILEFPTDILYIGIASSTNDPKKLQPMEQELVQGLSPFLLHGWVSDNSLIDQILEKGKEILSEGLHRINPYDMVPNIVFYELSHRTNFVFAEPDKKLRKIEYTR